MKMPSGDARDYTLPAVAARSRRRSDTCCKTAAAITSLETEDMFARQREVPVTISDNLFR